MNTLIMIMMMIIIFEKRQHDTNHNLSLTQTIEERLPQLVVCMKLDDDM